MRLRVTAVGNDRRERPKGVVEERDVVADEGTTIGVVDEGDVSVQTINILEYRLHINSIVTVLHY